MNTRKILFLFLCLTLSLNFYLPQASSEDYTIKEFLEEALPSQEGRKIVLNEAAGLLTITDTNVNHKLIKTLIEAWDVGPRQITIEARFVEIATNDLGELGVEWLQEHSDTRSGGDTTRRNDPHRFYIGPGVTSTIPVDAEGNDEVQAFVPPTTGTGTFTPVEGTRPLWSGTELGAPAEQSGLGLWLGKTTLNGSQLFTYLRALEQTGKANMLSSPKITTLSGQMANIELANIFPYTVEVKRTDTKSAYGIVETYEIDERKVGIFLEVTPIVGKDTDVITLDIHPETIELIKRMDIVDSEQYPSNLGWPVVETRSTQTSVTLKSGETIVIGGLLKDNETVTERKVPVLGSIPILGNLFKYKHTDRKKVNLVIFLTASLINPEGEVIQ